MTISPDSTLLEALLDAWQRNNAITINLLRAIPTDDLDIRMPTITDRSNSR